jgi:hypothetical protein
MTFKIVFVSLIFTIVSTTGYSVGKDSTKTLVRKTADFRVNGEGNSPQWNEAEWINITKQESSTSRKLSTQVKLLYSDQGLYFLFKCEDQKITATLQQDFTALFKEDVIEVFIWPDQSLPVYLEYELSPLDYELVILVPNINGKTSGWRPWHYEGKRRTQHATSVEGGEKKSQAAIKSWTAEFFMPYTLLGSLIAGPPASGTEWRANLYRIDYDDGYTTWTWQKTTLGKGGNFHEYKKFGTLVFE